jgi:single-strand DNA-binding protein
MSEGMNKVFLMGNLGADPSLRFTGSGLPVLNMRLATNETYVDRNREAQERTEWHSVVVWGPRAEALSKILTKGDGVLVEGMLRTGTFEKDGVKRSKTEVIAREIRFTGSRRAPAPEPADEGPEVSTAQIPPRISRSTTPRVAVPPPPPAMEELPF